MIAAADLPPNFLMWATFAIIVMTMAAYALEKWTIETVSLTSIVAYLLLFVLVEQTGPDPVTPQQLVVGFANPAIITVLSLMVVGQALFNTDALETPSRLIAKAGGASGQRTMTILLVTACAFSAFMNNTPVVVMFIPIVVAIAAQKNYAAAKALMPLSFISILGGMVTLIGSSSNLLVAGVAQEAGLEIGFFEFTVPGLIMAGLGAAYVTLVMPRLLKQRQTMIGDLAGGGGRQFLAQIEVTPDHPLVGAQAMSGMFRELTDMTVRMVRRGNEVIMAPFEDIKLAAGDRVIVAATRKSLSKALSLGKANLPGALNNEDAPEGKLEANFTLAEAVVAPGAKYVGHTLSAAGISELPGIAILGVQRKSRMQRKVFGDIRLEPGDTLLIGGQPDDVAQLKGSRDLILLEWSTAIVPMRRYAGRAMAIFAFVIIAAATHVLPTMVAALCGALLMISTRCIDIHQAARAFDGRIFMMVGASLASAVALEQTGGAEYIANAVVNGFAGQSTRVILSAFFLSIAITTNILSNNATAVLFTPIAIRIAEGINVPAEIFVGAVIFAANCSFATPIGYQTNLLVMGPGHYRFSDFLVAGIPLVIILWLTYTLVGPWYYSL